jgi:hypothetical protein
MRVNPNSLLAVLVGFTLNLGLSGAAQAALQGRDLNGNVDSFEAYYDTVLDITWLADANYAQTSGYDADGRMDWAAANTWAAALSFTDGVNTYDNWRLPTVEPVGTSFNYSYSNNGTTDSGFNITSPQSEMAHMFYVTLGNPGYYTPEGALSGCYVDNSNTCLDNVAPFSNLQPYVYWSASEYVPSETHAWTFGTYYGGQVADSKTKTLYAWAVSSGDVSAVPEARTYALLLTGLGLIGWRARRRG